MLFSRARFSSVVREDSDEPLHRERSGSEERERVVLASTSALCSQRGREDVVADASSLIETDTHRLRTSGLGGTNSSGTPVSDESPIPLCPLKRLLSPKSSQSLHHRLELCTNRSPSFRPSSGTKIVDATFFSYD